MASIFNENERKLRKIKKIAMKIDSLADTYKALTDEELTAKTAEFKARLEKGEALDSLLVEAFATVREAAARVLGMRPYFVQLMGGIALHQGRIAEMGTCNQMHSLSPSQISIYSSMALILIHKNPLAQ